MKRNKLAEDLERAVRTLQHAGYTDCGGEYWKPPLGKPYDIQLADAYYKVAASLKDQAQEMARASEFLCGIADQICEQGIKRRAANTSTAEHGK